MASELPPLPNPLTPLAWLPPDIASQLEASRYLYSAVVGAWLWDVFTSFGEDFQIYRQHRFRLPDVIYILARLLTGGFIFTSFVFQVAPVGDCHALAKAIGWCGAFGIALNSLLFFFRVRAVFNNSKPLIALFAFLWLSTLAGGLTAPFGVDGIHIGTTRNCVNSNVKEYSSAGMVAVAVNDTVVFIAISIRLLTHSLASTWSERVTTFLSGRRMGSMSKALLQTGQLYYLATVGVNIVAMVVILTPSVPPVFRAMFSIPNVALQNAMACRVYRLIKLGLIDTPTTAVSSFGFQSGSQGMRVNTARSGASGYNSNVSQGDVENIKLDNTSFRTKRDTSGVPVRVDISQETEVVTDSASDIKTKEFA